MIRALINDLRRPGGGWTVGLLTIFGAMGILASYPLGIWPGPEWTASLAAIIMLFVHMFWGAHGYYPARF